jgi:heptosyltransferase-2
MPRVLIIQTAFIGDVVLATSLLESLHTLSPDYVVDFALRKGNESLFKNHPYIHDVLIWDKQNDKYGSLLKLLLTIRKNKYDIVINVQRYAATGFLTAFSGAKQKIGFHKNPFSFLFTRVVKHEMTNRENPIHEIERNQLLLSGFSGASLSRPQLYPSPEDFEKVQPYKHQPYIVIAPSSVWFTKQYPAHKWADFIALLADEIMIYIVGAASDKEASTYIQSLLPHKKIADLCGELSFLASAALMKDAVMNYVNDSAPMHFCSAVNAPVTAVYCSTIPAFGYGPLSDTHHIVETKQPLACKPCGLHGKAACPHGHFNCAETISAQQLLSVLPA